MWGVARCCLPQSPGQPQHHKYQNRIWWYFILQDMINRKSLKFSGPSCTAAIHTGNRSWIIFFKILSLYGATLSLSTKSFRCSSGTSSMKEESRNMNNAETQLQQCKSTWSCIHTTWKREEKQMEVETFTRNFYKATSVRSSGEVTKILLRIYGKFIPIK